MVAIEVETHAVGGNIRATLSSVGINMFLNSGEEKMSSSMIFSGHFTVILEAALKHTLRGSFAAFALLVQGFLKFLLIILGKFQIMSSDFFNREFVRKAVGILKFKEVATRDFLTF